MDRRVYAVDCIVRHFKKPVGTRYVIGWYAYNEERDTAKSTEDVAKQYRDAYWRRLGGQ